jgi:uncharacterized protein YdhG (YjbR/CyaY superfamily)
MTDEPTANAIDRYLEVLPAPDRDALARVRRIILDVYPHADERISYGIIVFRLDDRDVVGVGRQADHLGFYTMSPVLMNEMSARLDGRELSGKSVLRFTPEDQIAGDLILRIVRGRLTENAAQLGS